MRSLTLLGVRTPGKTEERSWCLSWLLNTRVSVGLHVPSRAGAGFLEVLKNTAFILLMRHILIRSLKLLASHLPVQWLQDLV